MFCQICSSEVMMPFSEYIAEQAWRRAGGKCQCERPGHGHEGRCNRAVTLNKRGRFMGEDSWEARRISGAGGDDIGNCRVMCWDCHSKAF